jgi:glycosyltransferase involved in cell wall biosynthesis
MKILTVLTYYHPHWTGLTTIAKGIAEGLAERGHQVTVLTTRHDPALPAERVEGGVRVVRIKTVGRFSRGQIAPGLVPVAARLAKAHDAVQIHTPLPEAPLVAAVCRAERRPIVMTHQGDLVMPAGLANQVVQRAGNVALNLAGRLATRITTHSADYANHSPFLRPFAGKVVAIPPPVDMPLPDADAVDEWRGALGLEERRVVGFAGRFVEEKGFDYLLRALPDVAASVPEVCFLYAGQQDVVYERFYERCLPLINSAGDRLAFVGLITDRQRLAQFYALCDVFVLPSRTDCFGTVQVEAMLSGTPVVATDIPGARSVVATTGMGLLVPPRDTSALAAGIVLTLQDPAALVKKRAAVRQAFDPDRSIAEYEALFERLVNAPS